VTKEKRQGGPKFYSAKNRSSPEKLVWGVGGEQPSLVRSRTEEMERRAIGIGLRASPPQSLGAARGRVGKGAELL